MQQAMLQVGPVGCSIRWLATLFMCLPVLVLLANFGQYCCITASNTESSSCGSLRPTTCHSVCACSPYLGVTGLQLPAQRPWSREDSGPRTLLQPQKSRFRYSLECVFPQHQTAKYCLLIRVVAPARQRTGTWWRWGRGRWTTDTRMPSSMPKGWWITDRRTPSSMFDLFIEMAANKHDDIQKAVRKLER